MTWISEEQQMAVVRQTKERVTVEAFIAFTERPENAHKRFELIYGEIVEVPSNGMAAMIAINIATLLKMHLMQNKLQGHVTGADGGFTIDGNIFAPDVAYIDQLPPSSGFMPFTPILAVEVVSDPQRKREWRDLQRKTALYMRLGIVLWVVDFEERTVEVFDPQKPSMGTTYRDGATLLAGDYLPGFRMPLRDIFPPTKTPKESADA